MAEKKNNKTNIQEKLSEELGIPKTVVSGFNHIELFGNREAVVNGCEGILEYSDEKIKINEKSLFQPLLVIEADFYFFTSLF